MVDKQDGEFGVGNMEGGEIKGNAKVGGVINENCKSETRMDMQSPVNGHTVNVQGEGHHFHFQSTHESKCNSPPAAKESIDDEANVHEAIIVLTAKLRTNDLVEFKGQKFEFKTIVAHLKKRYDIDLTIMDVSEGSVKIRFGGSKEDIEKLKALFESGELKEILDIPIQDVQCEKSFSLENADKSDVAKRKSKPSVKQPQTNQHSFYDGIIAETKRFAKEEKSKISVNH